MISLTVLYDSYLKPNNLTDNYEFLRDDLISVLIKACGNPNRFFNPFSIANRSN